MFHLEKVTTNLQRVLDAQIVDGKIKKVYGYERVISKEEN